MKRTLSVDCNERAVQIAAAAPNLAHAAAQTDAFQALGLPRHASWPEVRAAFVAGLKAHPPERSPDGFLRIVAAYQQLKQWLRPAVVDAAVPEPAAKRRRAEPAELMLPSVLAMDAGGVGHHLGAAVAASARDAACFPRPGLVPATPAVTPVSQPGPLLGGAFGVQGDLPRSSAFFGGFGSAGGVSFGGGWGSQPLGAPRSDMFGAGFGMPGQDVDLGRSTSAGSAMSVDAG
mmetsp:Transcript_52631/g.115402  ORF Transcript_52631/g.115402 Transcript_52631/m.115402 type:complete len:232 (+) Transcript_52631:23-718(+)